MKYGIRILKRKYEFDEDFIVILQDTFDDIYDAMKFAEEYINNHGNVDHYLNAAVFTMNIICEYDN